MPASFSFAQRSATPRAQKKIFRLRNPPVSAVSRMRAYIFSYSRGTESTMVGLTSARFTGTVSIDSAYAIEVPVANIR